MRFVDIMLTLPELPLLLILSSSLRENVALQKFVGSNLSVVIIIFVLVFFGWMGVERLVRGSVLTLRSHEFIEASRALGSTNSRIIFRHMAPNVVAPYLIMLTAFVAQAILAEASVSFLGLGVTEPTPSRGLMLSSSAVDFYQQAPWMIVFPGIAISLGVFAFNLFGDSLRDALGTPEQMANLNASLAIVADSMGARPQEVTKGFSNLMRAFDTYQKTNLAGNLNQANIGWQAGLSALGLAVAPMSRAGRATTEYVAKKSFQRIAELALDPTKLKELERLARVKPTSTKTRAFIDGIVQTMIQGMAAESPQTSPMTRDIIQGAQ